MKFISIDPFGSKSPHSLSFNVDRPVSEELLGKVRWIAQSRGMPFSFSVAPGRLCLTEQGGAISAKTLELIEKMFVKAEAMVAKEASRDQGVRAAMLAAASVATGIPLGVFEEAGQAASAHAELDGITLARLGLLAKVLGATQRLNALRDRLMLELSEGEQLACDRTSTAYGAYEEAVR